MHKKRNNKITEEDNYVEGYVRLILTLMTACCFFTFPLSLDLYQC